MRRMHTARLPPDLLYTEWFAGKREETWDTVRGRQQYVYHKNLLDHVGAQSSFAIRAERMPFPRCFDSMANVWSIQAQERFQVSKPARGCQAHVSCKVIDVTVRSCFLLKIRLLIQRGLSMD